MDGLTYIVHYICTYAHTHAHVVLTYARACKYACCICVALLQKLVVDRQSVAFFVRSVNGGRCEDAQRYLSEQIARNETFLAAFDRLVSEVVLPYMKQRLVAAGVAEMQEPMKLGRPLECFTFSCVAALIRDPTHEYYF